MAEAEPRGALRRIGVSRNRVVGTGLRVARGPEKGDGGKEYGFWLREVELLRLVLRFSGGVGWRRAKEEDGRFSVRAEALEQAAPGLPGAGFRLDLGREPAAPVGDETPACALSSPAVGLLAPQGWLRTDVVVEQSGRDESGDWVMVSLHISPPLVFFAPPEKSSKPIEPCLEELGVTVHPWDCCPLVCEWTLVIDSKTPLPPSPGLHT